MPLPLATPRTVWSATPTPFHPDLSLDFDAIGRLVEHHCRLGIEGVMLGGTCGEGPWMPHADLAALTQAASEKAAGRLQIAVQITDNSAKRMLALAETVAKAGAEYAVIATPYFLFNATPQNLLNLYLEVIRKSPIPVCFYDRGKHAAYPVAGADLPALLAEPNLHFVKDSSADPERRRLLLEASAQRPELRLFTGDEFDCVTALQEGYHGVLLGGGIFNGALAAKIAAQITQGNLEHAQALQRRMNELMFRIYGGTIITCWLTGLKYLLAEMDIFRSTNSYLHYPLTTDCKAAIDEILTGADANGYRCELFPNAV